MGAGLRSGRMRRFPLATLLALLTLAAPAAASPGAEVGVADDRLLFSDPATATRTVAEWQRSGVETVRVFARWGAHAPRPRSNRRPAGFNASDPNSPGYDWRGLDQAIGAVRGGGLRVMLTVTGWGPLWGSAFPVRRDPRYKPSPKLFAQFARAVGRRYGGEVDRYIMWNEPNVAFWLKPQQTCNRRRCTPYAPHLYRRLARAGAAAVRKADPGARILVGALAPRGTSGRSANGNMRPLTFLREMGCVTSRFRKLRKGRCRGFAPITADGLAYHPHGLKLAPSRRDRTPGQAHLADLGRLVSAVDRITRRRGLRVRGARRMPLYLDEYAYQTRPPDRVLGVSMRKQSRYLQQAAYIAWRHPRVKNLTWYVWRDEPVTSNGAGWQSGVRRLNGKAKPAFRAFRRPFWAARVRRGTVRLWGQVRPGGRATVTIERTAGRRWRGVKTLTTDRRGGFIRTVRIGSKATFRFRWSGGASDARTVRP